MSEEESKISDLCRKALHTPMSTTGALKTQCAVDDALRKIDQAPPRPIMTLSEAADYLRVTREIIEETLESLPCFELGGKLLFRKIALDEWIQRRERKYAGELIEFNVHQAVKFTIA